MTSQPPAAANSAPKCACQSCHCPVPTGKGLLRDGRLYCSATCAYDCTPTTCLCIHDACGDHPTTGPPRPQNPPVH